MATWSGESPCTVSGPPQWKTDISKTPYLVGTGACAKTSSRGRVAAAGGTCISLSFTWLSLLLPCSLLGSRMVEWVVGGAPDPSGGSANRTHGACRRCWTVRVEIVGALAGALTYRKVRHPTRWGLYVRG